MLTQDQQKRILSAELACKTVKGDQDPIELAQKWFDWLTGSTEKARVLEIVDERRQALQKSINEAP